MRTASYISVFVTMCLSLGFGGVSFCTAQGETPESAIPDFVIVPFANNTGQAQAHTLLMPRLEKILAARGHSLVSSSDLRPLLREHRVRSRGWIGRKGARLIGAETGARYLLLGSWDVLKSDGNIEVGVSMRILDLQHLELISAVSVGGTGEDAVSWLDLGRVDDLEALAESVMEQAVEDLLPVQAHESPSRSARGCNHVAVIPLDDFSATEFAGDTVTNILLCRLMAAGYFVVEPGFVRELGLAREVVSRGGVDRASAQAILDSLGACQVITGAVQRFDPAQGQPTLSVPRFAAGLRASSTRNGALYIMRELEGTGSDGDGIFQLGRVHAITPLVVDRIDRFVADLQAANRRDIIHGATDR